MSRLHLVEISDILGGMTNYSDSVAQHAADELRRMARYNDTTLTDLADALSISRQTLTNRLNSGTLTLAQFVELANAIGDSPASVLYMAMQEVPNE